MPAVWAYSTAVPGLICEDARLLGDGTDIQYPAGNDRGQAGWDIGLGFKDIRGLAALLGNINQARGRITRLAINLHGAPGKIDANGTAGQEKDFYDSTKLFNEYKVQLESINAVLDAGAVVLIMGCMVGRGKLGEDFLSELSRWAFRGHKVVGFWGIGETLRQARPAGPWGGLVTTLECEIPTTTKTP
jgi:hypothetical protein